MGSSHSAKPSLWVSITKLRLDLGHPLPQGRLCAGMHVDLRLLEKQGGIGCAPVDEAEERHQAADAVSHIQEIEPAAGRVDEHLCAALVQAAIDVHGAPESELPAHIGKESEQFALVAGGEVAGHCVVGTFARQQRRFQTLRTHRAASGKRRSLVSNETNLTKPASVAASVPRRVSLRNLFKSPAKGR